MKTMQGKFKSCVSNYSKENLKLNSFQLCLSLVDAMKANGYYYLGYSGVLTSLMIRCIKPQISLTVR